MLGWAPVLKVDKGKGNSWGVGVGGEGEVEQGEALVSFLQTASLLQGLSLNEWLPPQGLRIKKC